MKNNRSMKFLKYTGIIIVALFVAMACKKDDDGDDNTTPQPTPNPLVGTYTFVAATFDEPITVIVNGDTNNYQAGDDA